MRLEIYHADYPDDPNEDGLWRVHSFCRRHMHFTDPDEFATPESVDAVKEGQAFYLSYFEHGNCVWSLMDEGPQCRFDSVRIAGYLEYYGEGKPTEADAREFLEYYTDWCNGSLYDVQLLDEDGDYIDCQSNVQSKSLKEVAYGMLPALDKDGNRVTLEELEMNKMAKDLLL